MIAFLFVSRSWANPESVSLPQVNMSPNRTTLDPNLRARFKILIHRTVAWSGCFRAEPSGNQMRKDCFTPEDSQEHKMIRVDSIHKTLLQFLPTWDVPTAKILRNRMIHFREHDKPNRNQDRWSPQVCLRRSTESGLVHSSKVWFRVIGSIGSG